MSRETIRARMMATRRCQFELPTGRCMVAYHRHGKKYGDHHPFTHDPNESTMFAMLRVADAAAGRRWAAMVGCHQRGAPSGPRPGRDAMKVILGPLPCRSCGSPVTIVRRDVVQPCGPVKTCDLCGDESRFRFDHTHTLPDVGPFTPVDEDGTRHECSNG